MNRTTPINTTGISDKKQVFQTLIGNPGLIVRELNNRSFFHFLQYFWSVISSEELILNWHIEYLCNELQEVAERVGDNKPKLNDILINIPPGTTKTTIVSIMFVAWCWSRWYWMRFITASYSSPLALESSETCRDLIRSNEYRAIYPEIGIKEDKDTKSNYRVIKKTKILQGQVAQSILGGNRYTTSVGGSVTGFHAHIIIWDDPINPHEATSSTVLNSTNRWIDQVISTRKVDKKIAVTIGIMQRVNQNDPSGHLLDKQKSNLKHICLPGEIINYSDQVKPIELKKYYKDGLLDPTRLNKAVLNEMEEDLGQYGYAGQVGQKPTPPGGGMFKVDKFEIIDTLPHIDEMEQIVRYWDKAGTQGGGCFTVGCKMTKLRSGKFIIIDIKRGQWGTDERERRILNTAEFDGARTDHWIEQEPGSGGKESAESTKRNLAGHKIYADLPKGDKIYRADPYSVQVNNGNIMLLRGEWNREFINEHENFPFSTYKDQVDAASGAFSKVNGKRKARAVNK